MGIQELMPSTNEDYIFLHGDNISLRKTKHEKETKNLPKRHVKRQNHVKVIMNITLLVIRIRYIRYSSPSPLLLLDTGGFKKNNFLSYFY